MRRVCETFLYYAIEVDQKMLVALNAIITAQYHPTTNTMGEIVWLLNNAATHPDATIHYHASYMIIHVAIDVSYLCEGHAHSQSGGHFPCRPTRQ